MFLVIEGTDSAALTLFAWELVKLLHQLIPLFICSLFNDAVSFNLGYKSLNDWIIMINHLERIWTEAVAL
jgi:hypothetical protein